MHIYQVLAENNFPTLQKGDASKGTKENRVWISYEALCNFPIAYIVVEHEEGGSYFFFSDCEVRFVIKFWKAQKMASTKINSQLRVYGPDVMSKQKVRRWYRDFPESKQNFHDEQWDE